MRILIPTADYPPIEGGIATVALQLARELSILGHEITVVAPWFPGMEDFDAGEPVRIVRFRGYDLGPLRVLPMLAHSWSAARDSDLMLAINIGQGGVIARLAQFALGTPYVTFAYAYEFLKFAGTSVVADLYRNIYRNARKTVAISRFTRDTLEQFGVPAEAIATILPGAVLPQPVPPAHARAVRERFGIGAAPFILAVGRFVPRKGQQTLVKAMPRILERAPEAHVIMAGRGPCLEPCLSEARALGLQDRVHCPGYVDDETLAALYSECAVFALPTGEDTGGHVEGFGLVFVEANAYGKPVVAGRSGGVEDAVAHGETGLLVPPDDEAAVAEAVGGLLTYPEEARRMGEAGRARVERELNWACFARGVLAASELPGAGE